jgi:hypothetical protein
MDGPLNVLRHRVEEILASLPAGCVVDVRVSDNEHVALDVRLTPSHPYAAPLALELDAGHTTVFMAFGEDSRHEIAVSGWRSTKQISWDLEVRAICDAVVRGRLTEHLWFRDGAVLRSEATIDLLGEQLIVRHVSASRGAAKGGDRVTQCYAPYCTDRPTSR